VGVGRTAEGEVGSVEMMRCEARGSTRSAFFSTASWKILKQINL
jgi:hypothetical protein